MVVGWGIILYKTILNYINGKKPKDVLPEIFLTLKYFQTGALLEIFHSMFGLVASPMMTTLMQVSSRLFVVWFVLDLETFIKFTDTEHIVVTTLSISWSVTEVIRYSFYALKNYEMVPYFLLWLRYSTFIVLYITGVASELTLCYFRLPYIYENRPFSVHLPNSYNFSIDTFYVTVLAMISYIPGFPQLYGYMFQQRKKVLSPEVIVSDKKLK